MSLLLLNMWLAKLAEDWTGNVNTYWGEEFFAVCIEFDNLFSSMHIQTGGGNMMCGVVFLKLTGWFFFICSCAPILFKLLTLDTIAWLMMEFTHWKKVSWGTSPYRDLAFQIQDFPVKVGKTINTDCTTIEELQMLDSWSMKFASKLPWQDCLTLTQLNPSYVVCGHVI